MDDKTIPAEMADVLTGAHAVGHVRVEAVAAAGVGVGARAPVLVNTRGRRTKHKTTTKKNYKPTHTCAHK